MPKTESAVVDPDLSEFGEHHHAGPLPPCRITPILRLLDEDKRAKLKLALVRPAPPGQWRSEYAVAAAKVARTTTKWLEGTGMTLSATMVQRHRQGFCGCASD